MLVDKPSPHAGPYCGLMMQEEKCEQPEWSNMPSILLVPERNHREPPLTPIRWIREPRWPVCVSGEGLVHTPQKHSLADKEQSQWQHFHSSYLQARCQRHQPIHLQRQPPANPQEEIRKGIKTLKEQPVVAAQKPAANSKFYTQVHKCTHIHTHSTISGSHSWC